MNCDTARNRLMAQPDPSAVPAPLAAHLDACPACQAWHQLLVRIDEGVIATAPVAGGSRAKRKLIAQFREAVPAAPKPVVAPAASKSKPLARPAPTVQPAPARQSVGERLARLWPGGLVAAALLIGVLVWASLRGGKNNEPVIATLPPDPFLERVVVAKVKLDTAPEATARLAVLDALERGIHDEATTLSKVTPGAEMESLARLYERVVSDGMVEQARLLGQDEKKAKLGPFRDRLVEAEQTANRLAAEAPPGADRPLKDIASAAGRGRTELAKLMQGGGAGPSSAAIAGGSSAKAPTPAQRGELYKRNRPVIEKLVEQTLVASRAHSDYLKQAESYYPVLYKFNTEIAEAGRNKDTGRVAELTLYLGTILDQGLAPTLIKARKQVEDGTGNEDYQKVKDDLLAQVKALNDILADNPAARQSLDGARSRLDEIRGPKKK
jgi:hypothetical protein